MKLSIQVETSEQCEFKILDTTCGDSGYLPESSQEDIVGRFKYEDTISISVLKLNKTDNSIIESPLFTSHEKSPSYITIPTKFDGWFTLNYIVIPTKEWFDKSSEKLSQYDTVYYSDGTNIYKYFNEESTIVEIEELIERNESGTTISRVTQDFTSICFLKKCFINLCKEIYEIRGFSKCKPKGNLDSDKIYNRDLLWMTINIISYLTEFGQLAEAERLIEQIGGACNGICKQYNTESYKNGCGCS